MANLRIVRPKTAFERFDKLHKAHDRALAEPKAAARHRKALLENMISHHDLGAGGRHSVKVQSARVLHELRLVVAECARGIPADGESLEVSEHCALRAL